MEDAKKAILTGQTAMMFIQVLIPFCYANKDDGFLDPVEGEDADQYIAPEFPSTAAVEPEGEETMTSFKAMKNFLLKNCTVERKLLFVYETKVRRGPRVYRLITLTCLKHDVDGYINELGVFGFGVPTGIGFVSVFPISYQGAGKLLHQNFPHEETPQQEEDVAEDSPKKVDSIEYVGFDPTPADMAVEIPGKIVAEPSKNDMKSKFLDSITEKITLYEALELVESGKCCLIKKTSY